MPLHPCLFLIYYFQFGSRHKTQPPSPPIMQMKASPHAHLHRRFILLAFISAIWSGAIKHTNAFSVHHRTNARRTISSSSSVSQLFSSNTDGETSSQDLLPKQEQEYSPPTIIPEQATNIKVIYESNNILAIDKPPHISHHNSAEGEMGIVSCVRHLQQQQKITYQGRIYSVHRLDKVTSGILLFAKSSQVAHELSEAFKNKNVTKYYVALTNKKAKKKKQGWVKGDMVQSRRKTWKLMNTFDNPASTRFFTAGLGNCRLGLQDGWVGELEQNCVNVDGNGQDDNDKQDERSLLLPKTMILFRPHTGKTHQLRVAAKSLGMPILGDQTYSDAIEAKSMKRAYLHALALHVVLNGETVVIYNPPTLWFQSIDSDAAEGKGKAEGNGLEDILDGLMAKHCENDKMMEEIVV